MHRCRKQRGINTDVLSEYCAAAAHQDFRLAQRAIPPMEADARLENSAIYWGIFKDSGKNGAERSLSEMIGASCRGQSIPIVGSFQRMARSWAADQ